MKTSSLSRLGAGSRIPVVSAVQFGTEEDTTGSQTRSVACDSSMICRVKVYQGLKDSDSDGSRLAEERKISVE